MIPRLVIENDGQLIWRTNFWELPQAIGGRCAASCNLGAFRLLLPVVHERDLREMSKANGAVVSRGPWPRGGLRDAFEFRFDDGTDSPFTIIFSPAVFENFPYADETRIHWKLTVWTKTSYGKPCLALELPCRYRFAAEIPDPRPWDDDNSPSRSGEALLEPQPPEPSA